MAKLMMHRNILKMFPKLPSKVQKRVSKLIGEFEENPESPAIGMHPLPGTMLDPKVRGITKFPDGYRAIVIAPERGDTYLLIHIDSHDKAYNWAKNKRFEVHPSTGVFQIFDTEEADAAVATEPTSGAAVEELEAYPLQKLSDDALFDVGVPRPLIPAVRSISSDAGLEALIAYLPPDCRDVLYGLAAGMSVEETLEEMLGVSATVAATDAESKPTSSGDFSQLNSAPNFDLVLVDGEEKLKAMLKGSLEEWRIFLHPYQTKVVKMKTKGPMNITGAAGTGKTVAIIHRAVHLAKQLTEPAARVLVTTFTTNLSVTLKQQIERLDPAAATKIQVTNLHALAWAICNRVHQQIRSAEPQDIEAIWSEVLMAHDGELPLSVDELKKEYDLVVEANGIETEEEYLTTVRSGRGRMGRKQRREAWTVFREFRRGLKQRGLLTFEGAVHQARLAVEQGKAEKYSHVLVDEAQDFSLEALRLIQGISYATESKTDVQKYPDPLCTAGDAHQRIYRVKIPMSRAGIDIRGRSCRLKINYRTTEQIRQFAQSILHGVEIDDLDDNVASTTGDHSVISGAKPRIVPCESSDVEAKVVVAWVESLLDAGFATHEICVTPLSQKVQTALGSKGIPTHVLQPRQVDLGSQEPGIRLATMQRIKGLEFRAVAMLCSDANDPLNHLSSADTRSKCTRYVAATRAREQLLVSVASGLDPQTLETTQTAVVERQTSH